MQTVDASRLSVEEIRSIAERHKQENPNLSLIMADYLGLIEKPKADRNDLAIAHISGSLKAMAKDLKTPVISLSQLSRDVEKRPNKRPTNADLRDSGSIEQDADSIIMLYFEVNVHGQFGGIVYYQEIQPLTFDCHAMYLPEIRSFSKEIGLAFWRYILTNTTVQCVTSFAARKFRHGQIYCAMIGLKRVGTVKKYFKGVDDVTFYSATREELIDFLNHGR